MPNTYNSRLAREARNLQRTPLWRQPWNLSIDQHPAIDDCHKRLRELGNVGVRYGNHRKMYSKMKVEERRSKRRALNNSIELD